MTNMPNTNSDEPTLRAIVDLRINEWYEQGLPTKDFIHKLAKEMFEFGFIKGTERFGGK